MPKHFSRWRNLYSGLLLVALLAASAQVLAMLEKRRPHAEKASELIYLPKGEYLKVAALGYEHLLADLIWLKAVQHFSGRATTAEQYQWAYHTTDVVTDLDPHFTFAYQAAGTILGVWAGRIDESNAILKKGVRHNPESWHFPFILGYNYFYELCDPIRGAEYLRTASALPGAPAYLPKLAARMTVHAGDPGAALEFLQRLYHQAKDERVRETISQRIKEVVAEQDIAFLQGGVKRYRARYGRMPSTLGDLVTGGIIARVPEEPLGGRYILNTEDGEIVSTGLTERLQVHVVRNTGVACHRQGAF